ncbi:Ger(x)C family spore germination protein [Ectobacillus ponti]|uniref:Ger(X)C family spore germination protein n=1 Tax=Ectobacillus ponti TaxID=2961894 RepID=A0AA42BQ86_9BACI|nr:Ger(x)C family spore germination protein [Ectobacillus ponti]MCP8968184.1 Ger(x)C family spore germination protein [Ectobacillus ponti]
MARRSCIFLCFLLLCGCGVESKILEDIQLSRAAAYDAAGDHKIKGTLAVTITPPGQGGEVQTRNDVFVTSAHTGKTLRQLAQAESPKPILTGKVGVVLYGEELAKQGISPYVDGLRRDPSIGRDLYVALAEGEAGDILTVRPSMGEDPGSYIRHLLAQNEKGNFPETDLQEFLYHDKGEGMDAILPLLKRKGNHIRIQGIALLKKDKYIGKYIPYNQAFIYKMLDEPFKRGIYEFHIKKDIYVTFQSIASSVHYSITDGNTHPKVDILVKLKGRIVESGQLKIHDPRMLKKLEQHVSEITKKQAQAMIELFQKEHVDPLGIGDHARSQTRGFNMQRWDRQYSTMPISVHVDVNILESGITE